MKYINAEKLIAEIERLVKVNKELKYSRFTEGIAAGYGDVLSVIASLQQEQQEVDLEKEIDRELDTRWKGEYLYTSKFRESARHFYELGLKTRK